MDKWEKEFEERIRKKLSDAPVGFDPAAWEKMEQRLYPVTTRGGWLSRWWLRAAAAVILLAVAGIWAYTTYVRPASAPENQLTSVGVNQPAATSPSQPAKEQPAMEEQTARKEQQIAGGEDRSRVSAERLPTGSEDQTRVESSVPIDQAGRQGAPEAVSTEMAAVGTGQLSDQLAGIQTHLGSVAMKQPAKTANTAQPVPQRGAEKTGGDKMSLSLGVLAAPDLNGVGGFNNSKAGVNVGIGLGVHFNDRLSLHSGIVYSRKPYNALPSDYHSGYSPQGLVNIEAVCDVIDIPLDLRYTIYRRGSNSIALSAGLSSYLMLREKYDYQYSYEPKRQYMYKNENRHFMGIGNFGVALERKINEQLSIGLEPFIKAPLTGIGNGDVRLISAGAALRLNLNLSKKRTISVNN